jgi:hypothetical protein
MRHRDPSTRRCTYLVVLERETMVPDELRSLATYLSGLAVLDCDVLVVDGSPLPQFERDRRSLRWVGRHVAALPRYRGPSGTIDPIRVAIELSACERTIVADGNVRYSAEALDSMCELLDGHEVVEPQDYFDPLPWWSGIEAGRMLVHRGVEPLPDHGATFGIRRSAIRGLRSLDSMLAPGDDHVRRLASVGAEVFPAIEVFVRRLPPPLRAWIDDLPRQAGDDFPLPVKTAFFFSLIPLAVLLAAFGGMRMVAGYAGAIAFGALAMAVRGRMGAGQFFPIRACLSAPLWVLERSVSVYWALFRKLRYAGEPDGAPIPDRAHQRAAGE